MTDHHNDNFLPPPPPNTDRQLERLVRTAEAPVLVTQHRHTIIANEAAEALLGYSESELTELPALELFHEDEREKVTLRARDFAAGNVLFPAYSTRLVNKAGEIIDVEIIGLPNQWQDRPAYLSFIRDRTREERLETELQRFRQLQSLGTLAGGMAHDFNNILMVIQSTVSLLIDDLAEDHPHRRDLEVIQSHVNSGANMTRRLLDYSRQRNSVTETLDLKAIVDQTVSTFAKTAKGIIVHTDAPDNPCWISANRSDVEQVLLNLFSNASDAMSQSGELRIELSVVHSTTDEPGMPAPPYAHLAVIDSGCGMDSKTLPRIFEPFFTTKGMGDGTGLGLSSVYGVITGHHGHIDVQSEPGHGSRFDIFLPIVAAPAATQPAMPREPTRNAGQTILVVDDETTILRLVQRLLKKSGYKVLTASSGRDAVEIYQEHPDIDVVILDMIMPGMSGKETHQRIKTLDPDAKVVFASGYSMDEQVDAVQALGCEGFLQKPYSREELARMLEEIVEPASGKE